MNDNDNESINDNEYFKWCLVRYLNLAGHNPRRITKANKDFAKRLDFRDIKFPVRIRDIHKIEKKKFISISIFGYGNKQKYPIYESKRCCKEKHVDLFLIEEGEKNTRFLSVILIDSCMIIHYIVEGNLFVVIVYMLSLQKKY